jgi:hypothetical protein
MSESDWSVKPRLIGELERGDHYHLTAEDRCLYFGEYTSRKGFRHGDTNQLISNLQKPVSRAGKADYAYKGAAIAKVARAIRDASGKARRGEVVMVPAPPSKPRGHPDHDDRIERICRAVSPQADVRCLLETIVAREQAKKSEHRPSVDELLATIQLVPALLQPRPTGLILIDDVITNGTTFKAAQQILGAALPDVKIVGLFVARRVFPPVQWDDDDDLDI